MKITKVLLIFFMITTKSHCYESYCEKVCQNIKRCVKLCENEASNSLRSSVELPHCGLTYLNDNHNNQINSNTVDQIDSKHNMHPWIVSIQFLANSDIYRLKQHSCSGAIINSRFILTAAHCIPSVNSISQDTIITIGTNDLISSNIKGISLRLELINGKRTAINHQNFTIEDFTSLRYDIGLIKTSKPIEFIIKDNSFIVNSICLPKANTEPFGDGILTGWANINVKFENDRMHKKLQKVMYPLIAKQVCHQIWERPLIEQWINPFSNEKMICTISKSLPDNETQLLIGDSGSPLIQLMNGRAHIIGVTSFIGVLHNPTTVYTQVSQYIEWIEKTIELLT